MRIGSQSHQNNRESVYESEYACLLSVKKRSPEGTGSKNEHVQFLNSAELTKGISEQKWTRPFSNNQVTPNTYPRRLVVPRLVGEKIGTQATQLLRKVQSPLAKPWHGCSRTTPTCSKIHIFPWRILAQRCVAQGSQRILKRLFFGRFFGNVINL